MYLEFNAYETGLGLFYCHNVINRNEIIKTECNAYNSDV